jgi:hypothetical protein
MLLSSGCVVGVGLAVGASVVVGVAVGSVVGVVVGSIVGSGVGVAVGVDVGLIVGSGVGVAVASVVTSMGFILQSLVLNPQSIAETKGIKQTVVNAVSMIAILSVLEDIVFPPMSPVLE